MQFSCKYSNLGSAYHELNFARMLVKLAVNLAQKLTKKGLIFAAFLKDIAIRHCHKIFFATVPEDFDYNPHSGRHGDRSHRVELKRSSVEYIAPSEYMVSTQCPTTFTSFPFGVHVEHVMSDDHYQFIVVPSYIANIYTIWIFFFSRFVRLNHVCFISSLMFPSTQFNQVTGYLYTLILFS